MTFTKVVWDLYTLYTRNHYLIVAQRCIEIPSPADLSTQCYRCNGFLIYRGLLQDVFQGKMIVDISRFASETCNVITAKRAEFRQFKQFKPPESNKPKRNCKNKQNMVSAIEREVFMSEVYGRNVVEFEFIS
ncbi:hypothetical protein GLOIN_2v1484948 [Rhizophagus irregularis DAOM 181602=DAOM 197198]|nr:hypothetical protein GLOIN_2v1484948 [Rhizophagus irregularis DAOM 181602=DAOM 197198]